MNKFLLLVFLIAVASCKKDDPIFSDTPEIEFVSITPSTAKEYSDKINIIISYKDGNGDLGENNASAKNIFVTDSRNGLVYQLRIQQLSPDGSDIAIQGKINIELTNTGITNGAGSQGVSYSVYVKDRAGNMSNTITTSAITVTK